MGTKLKVTNLDNGRATTVTVTVTGPSGSCALLNNAAFEHVREPGKNLIRRARIRLSTRRRPPGRCVPIEWRGDPPAFWTPDTGRE